MTANWCDTNQENVQDNQYTQRTNAQKEDITTLRVTTKIDQGSALEEFETNCNKEVKLSEKVQRLQKELENSRKREETWQLKFLNLQVQKITGYEASFQKVKCDDIGRNSPFIPPKRNRPKWQGLFRPDQSDCLPRRATFGNLPLITDHEASLLKVQCGDSRRNSSFIPPKPSCPKWQGLIRPNQSNCPSERATFHHLPLIYDNVDISDDSKSIKSTPPCVIVEEKDGHHKPQGCSSPQCQEAGRCVCNVITKDCNPDDPLGISAVRSTLDGYNLRKKKRETSIRMLQSIVDIQKDKASVLSKKNANIAELEATLSERDATIAVLEGEKNLHDKSLLALKSELQTTKDESIKGEQNLKEAITEMELWIKVKSAGREQTLQKEIENLEKTGEESKIMIINQEQKIKEFQTCIQCLEAKAIEEQMV